MQFYLINKEKENIKWKNILSSYLKKKVNEITKYIKKKRRKNKKYGIKDKRH